MLGWNSVSKLSHKRLFVFLGMCATVITSLNKSTFLTSCHGDLIQLSQRRDAGYNKMLGEGKSYSRPCVLPPANPQFCSQAHTVETVKERAHQTLQL